MGGLFGNGAAGKIINPIGAKPIGRFIDPVGAVAPKSGIGQFIDPVGAIGRKVGGDVGKMIDPSSLLRDETKKTLPPASKDGSSLLTGN